MTRLPSVRARMIRNEAPRLRARMIRLGSSRQRAWSCSARTGVHGDDSTYHHLAAEDDSVFGEGVGMIRLMGVELRMTRRCCVVVRMIRFGSSASLQVRMIRLRSLRTVEDDSLICIELEDDSQHSQRLKKCSSIPQPRTAMDRVTSFSAVTEPPLHVPVPLTTLPWMVA
jgi:hypothetical protein